MKKFNLRSALMLLLGIMFLFFTACGPGGSGESTGSSGGDGGDDGGGGSTVTNPTVAGVLYSAAGGEVGGSTVLLFSNPVSPDGTDGSFETDKLAKGTHTIVVTTNTSSDSFGTSYKNFYLGTSDLDLSVYMPAATLPFSENLANTGFTINSNTVSGASGTLTMVAQTSGTYKMLSTTGTTSVSKANFRLENWNVNGPLPCDLPSSENRAAGLNTTLGVQAPSVLVNVAPAMLRSLSPDGTLYLPNPDNLTNEKVLYFNPQTHLWENTGYTIAQSVAGNMPITKGGLYGVFEEAGGQTGTVKVNLDDINASSGDILLVGDKVIVVGSTDPITIPNVALPVNGGALQVIVLNPSSGTSDLTTVTITPGSSVYSWIDPIFGTVDSLTLSASVSSLEVGGSSTTITAYVEDEYGKPLAGATVNFTTSYGILSSATATTDADGKAQVTLTSTNTSVETVTVDADCNGVDADSALIFSFVPGDPSQLVLTSGTDSMYANQLDSTSLELVVRDAYGNIVADGTAVTFVVTNSLGASVLGLVSADSLQTDSGIINATFTANKLPEVYTVVAKYTDVIVSNGVSITLAAPPVYSISASASKSEVIASGIDTVTITATVLDNNSNPVLEGTQVNFTTTDGTLANGGVSTTNANGLAAIELTSSRNVGTVTVRASANNVDGSVDLNFVPGPPAHITFERTAISTYIGSPTAIGLKCTVTDDYGPIGIGYNPVADGLVVQFYTKDPSNNTTYTTLSSSTGITSDGLATVFFEPPEANEGVYRVYATLGGITCDTPVSINVLQTGPDAITVNAASNSIVANGTSKTNITAEVKDQYGNAAPDGTIVTFTTTLGTLNATAINGGLGTYDATTQGGIATVSLYSSTVVGSTSVRAEAGGVTDTVSVSFVSGSPAFVNVGVSPSSLQADGTSTADITALVLDANSNPVPGVTVQFSVTANGGSIVPVSSTTDNDGYAEVGYTASGTGGIYTITALCGQNITGTANVTLQQVQVASLDLTADGDTELVADGTSNVQLWATLQDNSGNVVADGTEVVFVNNSTYGSLSYIGAGFGGGSTVTVETFNGIAKAVLTSGTTAGRTAFVTATNSSLVDSITIKFIPGDPYRISAYANPSSIPMSPAYCPDDAGVVYATVYDRTNNLVADGEEVVFSIDRGWIWDDYPECPDDGVFPVVTSKTVATSNGVAKIGVLGNNMIETGTVNVCVNGLCYEDPTRIAPDNRGVQISYGSTGQASGLPNRIELSVDKDQLFLANSGRAESCTITAQVYDETGDPIKDSYSAADGEIVAGQRYFNSASASFITDGFNAGDFLVISSGENAAKYSITGVPSETQLVLDTGSNPFANAETGLSFEAQIQDNIVFKILNGPNSGENIDGNVGVGATSTRSTSNGLAYATFNSGSAPGSVSIEVTCTQGAPGSESVAVATYSDIVIGSGDAAAMTLYPHNEITQLTEQTSRRLIDAIVVDKFGNPVPDGSAVSFGLIDNILVQGTDFVITDLGTRSQVQFFQNVSSVSAGDTLFIADSTSSYNGAYTIYSVTAADTVVLNKQLDPYAGGDNIDYVIGNAQLGTIINTTETANDDYGYKVTGLAVTSMQFPTYAAGNEMVYLYAMANGKNPDGSSFPVYATWTGNYSPARNIGAVYVEVGNSSLIANGTSETILTATVYDSEEALVADGVKVTFTAESGTLSDGGVVYTVNGEASVTLTSPTTAGVDNLSACVKGVCAQGSITYVAGPVTTLNMTITPSNLTANGASQSVISVVARDANLNLVEGAYINFSVNYGTLSAGVAATNAQGYAAVTYTAPATLPAGNTALVNVSTANGTNASGNIALVATQVATVDLEPGVPEIIADGASSVVIVATVEDENGNSVPDGTTVTFTTSAGTLNDSSATTPVLGQTSYIANTVNGQARVLLFSSTNLGTATVYAVAGGIGESTTITFIPGSPAKVTVSATPSSLTADGTSTSLIKAVVLDANDNPVADGETITFSVTQDGGSLDSLTRTTVGGIASVTYTAPASVPDGQVRVYASTTSGNTGNVIIELNGPSIASVALEVDPSSLPADGYSKATVFATITLSGGGSAPDGTTVSFDIRSGGGTLSSTSATTSGGIAQVELTAGSTAGTAIIRAECGGRTSEISVEYEPGSVSVTVEQNSLLGTGEETTAIRVTLAKADGTALTSPETIIFTLSDLNMGTLSETSVNTAGPGYNEYNQCVFTGGTTGGSVDVIAKWTTSGVEVSGSATIDIQPPPAFLELESGYPDPASINIKGTGGETTSQLVFNVKDSVGNLVADGYRIDFKIGDGANGGEKVIPLTANTSSGQVGTILQSGLASGAVNVVATYHHNSTVTMSASKVTITNGPPVGEGLNMAPDYLNISGNWIAELEDVIHLTANDKYNNRIPEGSAIFFATYNTGGMLANGNAATDNQGKASDTLISTAAEAIQGWVSVTAEAINGGKTTRVTSMAFSPENPDRIMYVGTNGGGVYKSTNYGVSWTNMSKSSTLRGQNWLHPYVNDVAVDPDDSATVFAATGHNGSGALYRSLSGGSEWTSDNTEEVFGCLSLNAEITTVLCDDNNSDWVWVGTYGRGFVYSENGSSTPNITWYQAGLSSNVDTYSGTDGVTQAGSNDLTSAAATFVTNGFKAGDTVVITSGLDQGTYSVTGLTEHVLTLDAPMTADTSEGDVTSGSASTFSGSGVFVAEDATFLTSGYEAGDTITITDGKDAGTYEILSVDSETQVTLSSNLSTTVGETEQGSDGQYFRGQVTFTSASAAFQDKDFQADDRLIITSGDDIGMHTIDSVVDNNTVILTEPLTQTYADPRVGVNGDTVALTSILTLPSEDLLELGIEPGNTVAITSGNDIGAYSVTTVTGSTSMVINTAFTVSSNSLGYMLFYGSANPQSRSNGILRQNSTGNTVFSSVNATFVTDGFQKGDILLIETGANAGAYDILSVPSESTLILDMAYGGLEVSNLSYTVFHVRNNVTYTAYHKQYGYSTSKDNSYWTSFSNGFSKDGSAVLTSTGANFSTLGYEVGDIVTINSGSDAGVYTILAVTETELTLDRELNSQCQSVYSRDDGQTVSGSDILTSSSALFESNNITPGDTVIIASTGADAGVYTVVEVISQTQLRLDAFLTTTALSGDIVFQVYHACDSIDFSVYHTGTTGVSFIANHPASLVSFTITSNDVSDDDAGLHLRDGKWVRDIIKVDGNGANAVLYAGTQTGVYRSVNGGQNWGFLRDSFEGSSINCLDGTKIGNTEVVYAGTEDSGLWVYVYDTLADTGTWTNYTDGLDRPLLVTAPEAHVNNTGNGTLSAMEVKDDTVTEFWTLTCKTAVAGGGIFALEGSVSGTQADVDISAGPYTCPMVSFTLSAGTVDFAVDDEFTFNTVRDDGLTVADVVVDVDHSRLYAATSYYEGSDVYHQVGNLKVIEINAAGVPTGDWQDATSGLPEYDPPDDTTLFAVTTLALSNDSTGTPQAIFAGGHGIHLFKATDGNSTTSGTTDLSTGEVYWQSSEEYLSNAIMAREVILFSDQAGFQTYNSTYGWQSISGSSISTSSSWAEITDDNGSTRTVNFKFYIQDYNGNPPIVGTALTMKTYKIEEGEYKLIDEITLKDYGDLLTSIGTWRDFTNPDTNNPFNFSVTFGNPIMRVEFILTQSSSCDATPTVAPGCSGGNEILTYSY